MRAASLAAESYLAKLCQLLRSATEYIFRQSGGGVPYALRSTLALTSGKRVRLEPTPGDATLGGMMVEIPGRKTVDMVTDERRVEMCRLTGKVWAMMRFGSESAKKPRIGVSREPHATP